MAMTERRWWRWWRRWGIELHHDYKRTPAGSWAVDLVGVKIGRMAGRGQAGLSLCCLGIDLTISYVTDVRQHALFVAMAAVGNQQIADAIKHAVEQATGLQVKMQAHPDDRARAIH
jgi:hypothetical protein